MTLPKTTSRPATDQPGQAPLRLALVGLGNQGQEHLAAARSSQRVTFVAGVDPSAASRSQAATLAPDMRLMDNLDPLMADELDGLVLALPHHCYADIWDQVLSLGLPILKEKPLGRSFDEAMRLLDQARAAGCPVQTAIQRRHHPSYQCLKARLVEEGAGVQEAHAHLHLGFDLSSGKNDTWRGSRSTAGGGALLDAGYHMVDLLHYLVGPFDLVTSSLWSGATPVGEQEMDDHAWLVGRSEACWVMIDSCVGLSKSEAVVLRTGQDVWKANREGVWKNGRQVSEHLRDWQQAMQDQLESFARHIQTGNWHESLIWDQLPAMRVIDEAYRLAARY